MSLSASPATNTTSQLDQLELLVAQQRQLQAQLGNSLKQARADVGYAPNFDVSLPKVNSQTALLSGAVLASILMCAAMLWLWKTRSAPSAVNRRAPPEPFYKDSEIAKPSGFAVAAAPVAVPVVAFVAPAATAALHQATPIQQAAPGSSFSEIDFDLDDAPSAAQAADDFPVFSHSAPLGLDAAIGFEDSQVDFDLSDFDHDESGDDDYLNQPLPSLSVQVEPPRPEFSPVLDVQGGQSVSMSPQDTQPDDDEPMAVFVEGQVQLTDSTHDMLEWDLDQPAAAPPPLPGPALPRLRVNSKVDSEVPSQFDTTDEPLLPPAVPFTSPLVRAATPGFSAAPHNPQPFLQDGSVDAPVILPYEFELSEDDVQWAAELDLARELAEVGQLDEAESLCQEVFTLGTEPMREYALYILTRLTEFKRA